MLFRSQDKDSVLAILILILTIGCISPGSPEQRLLCLELSSNYTLDIPECRSQKECKNAVQEHLFQDLFLPSDLGKILLQYQNSLGTSWYHANQSLSRIENIQKICQNTHNYNLLGIQVNELKFHLEQSFKYKQSAAETSFLFLAASKAYLENSDINMVKEEPIFLDYAVINDNLNILESPYPENISQTYVGKYFSALSPLDQLSKDLGMEGVKMSEASLTSLWDQLDRGISKLIPNTSIPVPLITNTISKLLNYIENTFSLEKGVTELQKLSPYSFLSLYNNLAGKNYSAAHEFSLLSISLSSHLKDLDSQIYNFEELLEKEIKLTENSIESISDETYSPFDNDFLSALNSVLEQSAQLESSGIAISYSKNLKSDYQLQIEEIKSRYRENKDSYLLNSLSKGSYLSFLKMQLPSLSKIRREIRYIEEELLQGFDLMCSSRINYIQENLSSSEGKPVYMQDLYARISFHTDSYISSPSFPEKFNHCRDAVEQYLLLKEALNNQEKYEVNIEQSIDSCMQSLEILLSNQNQFPEERAIYLNLSQIDKPYINPSQIERNCNSLKKNLEEKIYLTEPVQNLTQEYQILYEKAENTESISDILSMKPFELEKLRTRLDLHKEYFQEDKQLNLELSLPYIQTLQNKSSSLIMEFNEIEKELMETYLEQNLRFEFSYLNTPTANYPSSVKILLILTNPFNRIEYPMSLETAFTFPDDSSFVLGENILAINQSKNSTIFQISSLEKGTNTFYFDVNMIVANTTSSSEIIFLSGSNAQIQQTIHVIPSQGVLVPKVKVSIPLESAADLDDLFIHSDEENPIPGISGNQVIFYATNLESERIYHLYYNRPNAILVSQTTKDVIQLDENTQKLIYEFTVTNNLQKSLLNQKINIPLQFLENSVKESELFDPEGKQVQITTFRDGLLGFTAELLPPNQPSQYSLHMIINDPTSYWKNEITLTLNTLYSSPDFKAPVEFITELESLLKIDYFDTYRVKKTSELLLEIQEWLILSRESYNKTLEMDNLLANLSSMVDNMDQAATNLLEEGFPIESRQQNYRAETSRNQIFEIQNLVSENNLETAKQLALELHSELQNNPPISSLDLLLRKFEIAKKEANYLSEQHKKIKIPLPDEHSNLNDLAISVSHSISMQDLKSAHNFFNEYSDILDRWNKDFNSSVIEGSKEIYAKITGHLERITFSIPEKAEGLITNLSFLSKEELNEINYIPPISKELILSYKNHAEESSSGKEADLFEEIITEYEDQNYFGALQLFTRSEKSLTSLMNESKNAEASLDKAIAQLSEDASVLLKITSEQPNLSDEEKLLLKRAEQEIIKGNPLKATYIASSLMNSPTPLIFLSEFPFLPVLAFLLIIGAGIYFYRKKTHSLTKKTFKKLEKAKE